MVVVCALSPAPTTADDAEERRVCSQPERDREHDRGGESGTPAEAARGPAKILSECVEPREAACVASCLFRLLDAPQRESRLAPRFVRRHSLANEAIRLDVDVKLQFICELALEITAPEQRAETEPDITEQITQHSGRSARLQHEVGTGHSTRNEIAGSTSPARRAGM